MANNNDTLLNGGTLSLGPCALFVEDPDNPGTDIPLLGFTSATLSMGTTKQDLVEAQNGTEAADSVTVGQVCMLSAELTRAGLAIMNAVYPAIEITYWEVGDDIPVGNTAGDIRGFILTRNLWERDSEVAKRFTLVELKNDVPQYNVENKVLHILQAAPQTPGTEFVFDASTQRVAAFEAKGYPYPGITSPSGRAVYAISNTEQHKYPALNIPSIYDPYEESSSSSSSSSSAS